MTKSLAEIMKEAGIVNNPEEGTPVTGHGPIHDPPLHFGHLTKETREFLADLDDEDLDTLNDLIERMNKAKTIGSFGKWLFLAILSMFATVATISEGIKMLGGWGWWR